MSRMSRLDQRAAALIRSLRALTEREKQFLRDEIQLIVGLMPLLMKPRNQQRWTRQDKMLLANRLRGLTRVSPYLAVLTVPGGSLMLPALAWWLDGRRGRNRAQSTTAA